jgi:hypothetical protein
LSDDRTSAAARGDRFGRLRQIALLLALAAAIGASAWGMGGRGRHSPVGQPRTEAPVTQASITALTLSPGARGYEEASDHLFGASEQLYRTFRPAYPFHEAPVPIFLITVRNPTDTELRFDGVDYDVSDVGDVSGAPKAPVPPAAQYHHALDWRPGHQVRPLSPAFVVPPRSEASFEILISSKDPSPGLGWLMRVGLRSKDDGIYTAPFQLFMPIPPDPGAPPPEVKTIPPPSDARAGLLERSVALEIGDPQYEACLFDKAGVTKAVSQFDALDRDMIMLHAGTDPIEVFSTRKTETDPPHPYATLFDPAQMRALLTMVKSHVACAGLFSYTWNAE